MLSRPVSAAWIFLSSSATPKFLASRALRISSSRFLITSSGLVLELLYAALAQVYLGVELRLPGPGRGSQLGDVYPRGLQRPPHDAHGSGPWHLGREVLMTSAARSTVKPWASGLSARLLLETPVPTSSDE
jgi:hypothetical protein